MFYVDQPNQSRVVITRVSRLTESGRGFVELRPGGPGAGLSAIDIEIIASDAGREQIRDLAVGILPPGGDPRISDCRFQNRRHGC